MNKPTSADSVIDDARIRTEILRSLADRREDSSCCPSEIARSLLPTSGERWRALMPRIRQVLAGLVDEERVVVTRDGQALSADHFDGGPIRIRRGKQFGAVQ